MKHLHIPLCIFLSLISCANDSSQHAGGTEIPNALQGTVSYMSEPVANAKVRLYAAPITPQNREAIDSSLTDLKGHFQLLSPQNGYYSLEVASKETSSLQFIRNIWLAEGDTAIGEIALQDRKTYRGVAPLGIVSKFNTVWFEGTPWFSTVQPDGSYEYDLPSSANFSVIVLDSINMNSEAYGLKLGIASVTIDKNNGNPIMGASVSKWIELPLDSAIELNTNMQIPNGIVAPRSTSLYWHISGENSDCSDSTYQALISEWSAYSQDTLLTHIDSDCSCQKVLPGIPICTLSIPQGHFLNGRLTLTHQPDPGAAVDRILQFHVLSID